MTIDYAILGMLSWKPMTGYDMKRIIQESPIMYWSGNNNQIYKSLVELLENGYVTNELLYQESAPNKKVYSITESGMAILKEWMLTTEPELPEIKKNFLIQLSWASQLGIVEIKELVNQYKKIIEQQTAMRQEEKKRRKNFPNRSKQEQYIWEMLYDNIRMGYEAELQWIHQFLDGLERAGKE